MLTAIKKRPNIFAIVLALLPNILSGYVIYVLLSFQILPDKYVYVAIIVIVVVNLFIDLFLLICRNSTFLHIIGYILSILVLLFSIVAAYFLTSAASTFGKITSSKENSVVISVIVIKDSEIYLVPQLNGLSASAAASLGDKYKSDIQEDLKLKDVPTEQSYTNLINNLYDEKTDVILFNESYRDLMKSERPDFDADTRVIKQYIFDIKSTEASVVDGSKPFNLYISGIDTYGPITTASLSDVNIVATINPITKKILLTTIPRDSYVPIALGGNDQYDKLTHAGIYGIGSSIATVENLMGIDLGAYVRLNFTSLIGMVDVIGGIELDNPVAFNSYGKFFPSGTIKLDGKAALTYSRERKNLANGDNDRGVNQERVIVALFNKIVQPSNLVNYQDILDVIGNSIQTNLSAASMAEIINMQLNSKSEWTIGMNSVSGKPAIGLSSYAMPSSYLYFTKLDEQSIESAKAKINSIIDGDQP